MNDLLVLLVAGPILAAILPIAAGLVAEGTGRYVALALSLVQVVLATSVLWTVRTGGAFTYDVGNYPPPFGIELVADGVSGPLLTLVALTTLGVVVYTLHAGPHSDAFYSELLILLAGLSGLVATGDVFNLYVFLEITGLATYAVVASGRSPRAAYASLKYLIVGTIGASFYLLGVGYLFVATGTLNMADLAAKIPAVGYESPLIVAGFSFIVVGLAVKVALFPLHTWQPDAYAESPHSVSAYIAALVSTAAAYALFRIVYEVFTVDFFAAVPLAQDLALAAAAVSIVVGAVLAVMQRDLKRMLAYSSVSHFGLIVAGIAIGTETAVTGGLIHLVGHGIMKGGLFLAVGIFATAAGTRRTDEIAGLGTRLPVTSGLFAILAFSMVGVPPAIGFPGKWNIVLGAVEAGRFAVATVAVASTLMTLGYFGRVVERLYFADGEPMDEERASVVADGGGIEPSSIMVAVLAGAAVATLVLGIGVSALVDSFDPVLEVYF
ncbi:MAG: monovalent cation/H+ antiporter subunit D family protein [Halodesulfurarchaeum sp.]